jgi:sporulation protein YlmC with PRC-barrel domain
LVLVLTAALVACTPATDAEPTPGAPLETPTDAIEAPVVEVTPTEMLPAPTAVATDAPTLAATRTPVALVTPAEDSETLPPTGQFEPDRLTTLMGLPVSDESQQLGNVSDMLIDMEGVRIAYVIVDTVVRRVAVPWEALMLRTGEDGTPNAIRLAVSGDRLEAAQDIDLSGDVGQAFAESQADIRSFWEGELGVVEVPEAQTVMRATDLMGTAVRGGDDQVLAEIQDAIVDTQSGSVQYLLVLVNEELLAGNDLLRDRLVPVPTFLLEWDAQGEAFILAIDFNVEDIPSFTPEDLDDVLGPGWDEDVRSFFEDLMGSETP